MTEILDKCDELGYDEVLRFFCAEGVKLGVKLGSEGNRIVPIVSCPLSRVCCETLPSKIDEVIEPEFL